MALSCLGSRWGMSTNAIPGCLGRGLSRSVKASSPPAEAPTPTTTQGGRLGGRFVCVMTSVPDRPSSICEGVLLPTSAEARGFCCLRFESPLVDDFPIKLLLRRSALACAADADKGIAPTIEQMEWLGCQFKTRSPQPRFRSVAISGEMSYREETVSKCRGNDAKQRHLYVGSSMGLRAANSRKSTRPPVLNSWKEIASYLGRGVRTVQRYERDFRLPIRPAARQGSRRSDRVS